MKLVFVLIAVLFLNGCFYPAPRTKVDPITQAPTEKVEASSSGGLYTGPIVADPYVGLLVVGAAVVETQKEKNKKTKKQPAFPKPPEEVLKPMEE